MAMACLVEHTRAALLGKHAMPHTRLRVMPPAPRSVPGLSSEPSPASQHLAGPTSARSENIVTGGEAFIRFRPSRVSRSIPAHSCPPSGKLPSPVRTLGDGLFSVLARGFIHRLAQKYREDLEEAGSDATSASRFSSLTPYGHRTVPGPLRHAATPRVTESAVCLRDATSVRLNNPSAAS